jgi:hypothetical protein
MPPQSRTDQTDRQPHNPLSKVMQQPFSGLRMTREAKRLGSTLTGGSVKRLVKQTESLAASKLTRCE